MSSPTPRRRMTREDRRTALLDAAAELLRRPERGPLTFDAIADEAGVSPTLPYKYFASVDEVAGELYRLIVGRIDDQTDRVLADPARPFDAKVRATLHLWTDAIRADGPVLLRLTDDAAHPSLRALVDARRERAVDVWATQIIAESGIEPPRARVVAASIAAGSSAVLARWIRDRLDREEVIELFVALARAQVDAAAAP